MNIEGTYNFDATQEVVWEAVLNPDVLSKSLPGIQNLEEVGENEYRAKIKVRIGPVQGQFSGKVQLVDLRPPNGYHIIFDASGAQGFVNGEGDLNLAPLNGGTELSYSGEAKVGGRIASVGQRLMDSSTRALIQQSLEAFDVQIQAITSGVEPGELVGAPEAPSEVAFAMGVAGKMLEDVMPPERREELIKAGAAAIVLLLLLRMFMGWWADSLAERVVKKIEEKEQGR